MMQGQAGATRLPFSSGGGPMAQKIGLKSLALAGGVLVAATAPQAGAAPGALTGQWAGERLQLVIDAQGGRVESDCASGRFLGPVTTSAEGTFSAQGSYEAHRPGPQAADTPPPASARYSGELQGGLLKLTITPARSGAAQVYTLQSGARIKLLRCL
jgi:hypothetical protein